MHLQFFLAVSFFHPIIIRAAKITDNYHGSVIFPPLATPSSSPFHWDDNMSRPIFDSGSEWSFDIEWDDGILFPPTPPVENESLHQVNIQRNSDHSPPALRNEDRNSTSHDANQIAAASSRNDLDGQNDPSGPLARPLITLERHNPRALHSGGDNPDRTNERSSNVTLGNECVYPDDPSLNPITDENTVEDDTRSADSYSSCGNASSISSTSPLMDTSRWVPLNHPSRVHDFMASIEGLLSTGRATEEMRAEWWRRMRMRPWDATPASERPNEDPSIDQIARVQNTNSGRWAGQFFDNPAYFDGDDVDMPERFLWVEGFCTPGHNSTLFKGTCHISGFFRDYGCFYLHKCEAYRNPCWIKFGVSPVRHREIEIEWEMQIAMCT